MGYIVFCTSKIVDDPRISDNVLRTFLSISNFLKADGYSFCSNKWLGKKRNLDERNVRRHLEVLEKEGYIWREVWNEGFKKRRRIWLPEKYLMYLEIKGKEDTPFKKSLREGDDVRSRTGDDVRFYTKDGNSKEESNSIAPTETFAAASLTDKYPKIFHELPKEEQALVLKCYEKKLNKMEIDNPQGLITDMIKGGWYKEDQNQEQEPQEPESVTNKKHNEPIAKRLVKTLECHSGLHILLAQDFIELGGSGQRPYTVLLSESPCVFSAQIKKVLEICKVDVDFPNL